MSNRTWLVVVIALWAFLMVGYALDEPWFMSFAAGGFAVTVIERFANWNRARR